MNKGTQTTVAIFSYAKQLWRVVRLPGKTMAQAEIHLQPNNTAPVFITTLGKLDNLVLADIATQAIDRAPQDPSGYVELDLR